MDIDKGRMLPVSSSSSHGINFFFVFSFSALDIPDILSRVLLTARDSGHTPFCKFPF